MFGLRVRLCRDPVSVVPHRKQVLRIGIAPLSLGTLLRVPEPYLKIVLLRFFEFSALLAWL
jgi:hypothetical protein